MTLSCSAWIVSTMSRIRPVRRADSAPSSVHTGEGVALAAGLVRAGRAAGAHLVEPLVGRLPERVEPGVERRQVVLLARDLVGLATRQRPRPPEIGGRPDYCFTLLQDG